jgi:TRAP-type C4-dicarboxylate transport system permease large subunit
VVPLILPLGTAFGIDPVHLGIIFLANLELGYLTPPVGMNLFLSSYRFDKPLPEVYRSILPILFVLLVGVLMITYIPPLTTFLPKLLYR